MSMRIIRSSLPNSASASARASSVLPTPVGPRNRKLPIGPVGVGQARAGAAHRLGDGRDRVVLADDPLVQVPLELEQPVPFLLGELRDRDAGRPGDDLGDVGRADLGDRLVRLAARLGRVAAGLLAQLGDLVAQRGGAVVVLRRHRLVLLALQPLKALLGLAPVPRRGLGPQPDPGARLVDRGRSPCRAGTGR